MCGSHHSPPSQPGSGGCACAGDREVRPRPALLGPQLGEVGWALGSNRALLSGAAVVPGRGPRVSPRSLRPGQQGGREELGGGSRARLARAGGRRSGARGRGAAASSVVLLPRAPPAALPAARAPPLPWGSSCPSPRASPPPICLSSPGHREDTPGSVFRRRTWGH